ncbi:MAG: alpha/beta hydrolase [Rickettsiales bacterium]|nr:alpha/beta hydrolase [Rickettsiales bacterium]
MFFKHLPNENSNIRLVWLHGWANTYANLLPLANLFPQYENYLLDLAGFGQTPPPNEVWSTKDYAEDIIKFIKTLPPKKTIVLGHSFGGGVGIQLAANFKNNIDGLVLIAGAGLKRKRGIGFKIYKKLVKTFSPILKKIFPFLKKLSFGTSDYRNTSGIMREIFKKAISEKLEQTSQNIQCPTLLIYGEKDTATPPYFGEMYKQNIKNSELFVLSGANHYTLLLEHNRQTQYLIKNFVQGNFK